MPRASETSPEDPLGIFFSISTWHCVAFVTIPVCDVSSVMLGPDLSIDKRVNSGGQVELKCRSLVPSRSSKSLLTMCQASSPSSRQCLPNRESPHAKVQPQKPTPKPHIFLTKSLGHGRTSYLLSRRLRIDGFRGSPSFPCLF